MDNLPKKSTLRQCFSLLPLEDLTCAVFDYRMKKMSTLSCIKMFLAAELLGWKSCSEMEQSLRLKPELQSLVGLSSMSGSQLNRRLDMLPTELLQALFVWFVDRMKQKTASRKGPSDTWGKLSLVDSSCLKLPAFFGEWTRVRISKEREDHHVKMHVKFAVTSRNTMFPENVYPTTGNVSDQEVATNLVTDDETTYIMDRGYVKYEYMDDWVKNKIRFVMRINEKHVANLVEEYTVPANSRILRDAKVMMGSAFRSMTTPVRLVEFHDEKQKKYRVVTSRWDLSSTDIAEMYRQRWLIELFFKWLKQHVTLVHLFSYKPQAIWNQMLLALISYALMVYIQVTNGTNKTAWDLLRLLRITVYDSWILFEQELNRIPSRTSAGRKKTPGRSEPVVSRRTTVGIIKPQSH